jgi:hypothetical protein
MKAAERRIYWRMVTRMQLRLQAKYTGRIKALLDSKIREFIDSYRDEGSLGRVELWNTDLLEVYRQMYMETYIMFARMQYRRLEILSREYRKDAMGLNVEWTREVNEWLARYGLQLVSTVTGNFRAQILDIINRAIQEGVEEGLGIDRLTSNILQAIREFGGRDTLWAERIARTETLRAANMGHMAGAKKHRFEVLKEWIAAQDTRTRRIPNNDEFDHWVLDGQRREIDEAFVQVGSRGRVASAQQPGDADAPAAFTINCRCTVAFIPKRVNGKLVMKPEFQR